MPDPQELERIVQRMIDAGEPEEAIASVIKEYPTLDSQGPEEPSIGGFLYNAAGSTVDLAGNMARGVGKMLTQNPAQSIMDIGGGLRSRFDQYAADIHPKDAASRLAAGHPLEALGSLLPVGLAYRDPAGVAADIVAARGLSKLPGQVGRAVGPLGGPARATPGAPKAPPILKPPTTGGPAPTYANPATLPELPTAKRWTQEELHGPGSAPPTPSFDDALKNQFDEATKVLGREPDFITPADPNKIRDIARSKGMSEFQSQKLATDQKRGMAAPKEPTMTVPEMRRMYGSREAAGRAGLTRGELLEQAPGPSRTPLAAEGAQMDSRFKDLISDERGMIIPDLLIGAALEELIRRGIKNPSLRGAVRAGGRAAAKSISMPNLGPLAAGTRATINVGRKAGQVGRFADLEE